MKTVYTRISLIILSPRNVKKISTFFYDRSVVTGFTLMAARDYRWVWYVEKRWKLVIERISDSLPILREKWMCEFVKRISKWKKQGEEWW